MSALTRLAEFTLKTTLADCPPAALDVTRRAALDTVGVILAGAAEPCARIVRQVVRAEGGLPLCTVLGTSLRTSPTWAALANGVAGHAHDFDDTNFALLGHPSVPLLTALLACAEADMKTGADVALGYVIGFEVSAALGAAVNPEHYTRGWHATSSIGTLGCAAAAARVLGLDAEQTRHALGVALSLASGLKENFGSMTKPYHAGHAARNGVFAATLAREGFTASATALEGAQGYLAAFGGGSAAAVEDAVDALGSRWQLLHSGIAVKPYPSCALTHATIDTLLELRAQHHLTAARVASIEVGVNAVVPTVLQHAAPATALERKFSMQYCSAAALVDGHVSIASFEDGPVQDAAVRDLMGRVTMVVDDTLPRELAQQAWTRVTVRLDDGRTLQPRPRGAQGHPDQPLSAESLHAKFLGCAERVMPRGEAEAIAGQIMHLEDIPDIRALTSRLVGDLD
jgi:2-methylcitrate dehydratase PrpD